MADPILWATVTIAASSLIFAAIAFRQVMKTSRSVDGFIKRADTFLDGFKKSAKGIFSPKFMAATIEETVTSGLKNDDGSQVTMPQYIAGWAHAVGPAIYQDIKKEIPSYLPILFNKDPQNVPSGAPQSRNAAGQFGSGGLKAAQNLAKATKKVPMIGKVGEVIETGQALVGLVQPVKEMIAELKGLKGGGGGNGESAPSTSTDSASVEWGPPI